MGFGILFIGALIIAVSFVRTIHPEGKNARTKFNVMSLGIALATVGVLAYNTVPQVQALFTEAPTIKVATNSLTETSGKCAVQHITVDPTDDIKDLQIIVTLDIDKPAHESVLERFTDAGRPNHYELTYDMDGDCHPKISPVPAARNLTFTLMRDGRHIRIQGRNVSNLDAGGIWVVIPGPVATGPYSRPKLTFTGEATYGLLGADLPAKLVWQDQGLQDYGYDGEQEIKPNSDDSERLIRKTSVANHWTLQFVAGVLVQFFSVWLGWVRPSGKKKAKPIQPLSSREKLGQAVLSVLALLLLIWSNSSATGLLTSHLFKKPAIQVVRYSIPPDVFQARTSGGCAVWGFSVRTNTSVNELHLVANVEQKIHSQQITDGSEFIGGNRLRLDYPDISFPCELKRLPNPNPHLDDDISTDRQQVIMYSERFTPPDKGGIVLSFYPVKESDPVLAFEWDMSAHYQDWFGNDQKLTKEDMVNLEGGLLHH